MHVCMYTCVYTCVNKHVIVCFPVLAHKCPRVYFSVCLCESVCACVCVCGEPPGIAESVVKT